MSSFNWTAVGVIIAGVLSGCGPAPVERFDISGTVTFDGQPLKEGTISFVPQVQSEIGSGFATITDGKFDTAVGGRGHLGGPHMVQITSAVPEGATQPPFEPYDTETALPYEISVKDFEVPSADMEQGPKAE